MCRAVPQFCRNFNRSMRPVRQAIEADATRRCLITMVTQLPVRLTIRLNAIVRLGRVAAAGAEDLLAAKLPFPTVEGVAGDRAAFAKGCPVGQSRRLTPMFGFTTYRWTTTRPMGQRLLSGWRI